MVEKMPTDMLEEEHHFISKVVGGMATLAEQLEKGEDVKQEILRKIVEFMRTFADKCHHGKEEVHLFPVLERKGVPVRGCPLGILVAEHQKGRALVKDLLAVAEGYEKGDPAARESLTRTLRNLTDLYPNHIWKEDYLLFPMTSKMLSSEDQKELLVKFEDVEREIGRDVHHQFEHMAEKIEKDARES